MHKNVPVAGALPRTLPGELRTLHKLVKQRMGRGENKKAWLSLGKSWHNLYSCSTDHYGHKRSMIFILSERAYAISYKWLKVTMALFLINSEIWPVFH